MISVNKHLAYEMNIQVIVILFGERKEKKFGKCQVKMYLKAHISCQYKLNRYTNIRRQTQLNPKDLSQPQNQNT